MDLLPRIGDYYVYQEYPFPNKESGSFIVAFHKKFREFLYCVKLDANSFDLNYLKKEKELSKHIPLVVKHFDTFHSKDKVHIFFDFFDRCNIINYISKYNNETHKNIPHRVIHSFFKQIVLIILQVSEVNSKTINEIFLTNFFLSKRDYTIDKSIAKNVKDASNETFIRKTFLLEEARAEDLVQEAPELKIKLLLSFKKEITQFFKVDTYEKLSLSSNKLIENPTDIKLQLGLIMYYLLDNYKLINQERINYNLYKVRLEEDLPSELLDLIQILLNIQPERLFNLGSLKSHPYITSDFNNLTFPLKGKNMKCDEIKLSALEYIHIDFNNYIQEEKQKKKFACIYDDYASSSEEEKDPANGYVKISNNPFEITKPDPSKEEDKFVSICESLEESKEVVPVLNRAISNSSNISSQLYEQREIPLRYTFGSNHTQKVAEVKDLCDLIEENYLEDLYKSKILKK